MQGLRRGPFLLTQSSSCSSSQILCPEAHVLWSQLVVIRDPWKNEWDQRDPCIQKSKLRCAERGCSQGVWIECSPLGASLSEQRQPAGKRRREQEGQGKSSYGIQWLSWHCSRLFLCFSHLIIRTVHKADTMPGLFFIDEAIGKEGW